MNKVLAQLSYSPNIVETGEGFLVCKNVPLSHTGIMEYAIEEMQEELSEFPELKPNDNGCISVIKPASCLFDPVTIASFENKPVTIGHEFVTPENSKKIIIGHAFNVRKGVGNLDNYLIADLMITDKEAIDIIKAGESREISLGYESSYVLGNDGILYQDTMIGNHIAIVDNGRAGQTCRIYDSAAPADNINILKEFFDMNIKDWISQTIHSTVKKELARTRDEEPQKDPMASDEDLQQQGDVTNVENTVESSNDETMPNEQAADENEMPAPDENTTAQDPSTDETDPMQAGTPQQDANIGVSELFEAINKIKSALPILESVLEAIQQISSEGGASNEQQASNNPDMVDIDPTNEDNEIVDIDPDKEQCNG